MFSKCSRSYIKAAPWWKNYNYKTRNIAKFIENIGRCYLKYKWSVLQDFWLLNFLNFCLKTKLRLLHIHTNPRYWDILTGISKHIKNMNTLSKEVVSSKKINFTITQNEKKNNSKVKPITWCKVINKLNGKYTVLFSRTFLLHYTDP